MAAITAPVPPQDSDYNYNTVTEWAKRAILETRKMGFPDGKVSVVYDVTGDVFTITFA